jgi:hypothetical protein
MAEEVLENSALRWELVLKENKTACGLYLPNPG